MLQRQAPAQKGLARCHANAIRRISHGDDFFFSFEFGCRDYVELKIGYVERCGMRDGKI